MTSLVVMFEYISACDSDMLNPWSIQVVNILFAEPNKDLVGQKCWRNVINGEVKVEEMRLKSFSDLCFRASSNFHRNNYSTFLACVTLAVPCPQFGHNT